MFTYHRLTSLLIFIVFLVSCTTVTSTVAPTADDLERLSTHTAPPLTPSPNITPSQTQIMFDQAAYEATQSIVQTKVAQFPRVCTEDYSRPKYSPNDLWMEELCYSENDHDLVMTLSNRETKALWKFLYHDYIPRLDVFPDGGMLVVYWSNDGRYAYFTSFLGGDGGECFFGRMDTGSGLFRIDLQTGQNSEILPLKENTVWYGFSLSPNDRRLVYGVHSRDLKVLNITTGQLVDVVHKSDFSQGGGYLWSPDGLTFVYSTVTYNANHIGREGYSLRLVDAKSGSERILLESPDNCFAATSWTESNIVMIEKNFGEVLIEFDLKSNKIASEATVTPYP